MHTSQFDCWLKLGLHFLYLLGPKTYLTKSQEDRLVQWLLTMAKIGYGVTRSDIPNIVKSLLDQAEKDGYVIPEDRKFQNNLPSKNWVARFLARHPSISVRAAENLGLHRAYVTEEGIRQWFENLKTFLKEEHSIDAENLFSCENAERIFNLDESGFALSGTNSRLRIIAERGSKNVYKLAPDSREQITVLACISSGGTFQKPLVLFPGVRTPKPNFTNVNPDDYDIGSSPNGWMTADVFFTWLSSIFFPAVRDKTQFPIIIFLDGHISHINLAVSDFCRDNNIIIYCFPAHASHVMQPLDIAVFGPLKKGWNKAIEEHKAKSHSAMTRSHFFQVFDRAWKSSCTRNNAVAGFKSSGLVPFNPDAVKYDRLITKKTVDNYNISAQNKVHPQEMLGMTRSFQVMESCLPNEIKTNFEKRYSENYNIIDETDRGILWQVYKNLKDMITRQSGARNSSESCTITAIPQDISVNEVVLQLDDSSATIAQKDDITIQAGASILEDVEGEVQSDGCSD